MIHKGNDSCETEDWFKGRGKETIWEWEETGIIGKEIREQSGSGKKLWIVELIALILSFLEVEKWMKMIEELNDGVND